MVPTSEESDRSSSVDKAGERRYPPATLTVRERAQILYPTHYESQKNIAISARELNAGLIAAVVIGEPRRRFLPRGKRSSNGTVPDFVSF